MTITKSIPQADAIAAQAKVLVRRKDYDAAYSLLRKADIQSEEQISYLELLAESAFRVKKFTESEDAARKLIALGGQRPLWQLLLGRALVSGGKPLHAKVLLLEASMNNAYEDRSLRWLLEAARALKDPRLERDTATRILQRHSAGGLASEVALRKAKESLAKFAISKRRENEKERPVGETGLLVHKTLGIKVGNSDLISDRIKKAFEAGTYEHWEGEAAIRVVKSGDRVLELGGGIGFISTVVGTRIPGIASYHVIEADPRLKQVIIDTHKANGVSGISVEICMVSADPSTIAKGEARFALAKSFTASSAKRLNSGRPEISVPVRSFTDVIREHNPNVLICDIEGSEIDVCEGDLGQFRAVMMEIHPDVFGMDGVARIFTRMAEQNLVYDTRNSSGSVVTFVRNWAGRPV